MEFDVVIVGAGPSGLSSAIKIKQLSQKLGTDISVCILKRDLKLERTYYPVL